MVLLLGILTALGPFTVDMYLPALPQITQEFGTSDTMVQLTLTGTLLGLAFGQLLIGPLSDIYGRRRPLLVGTVIHVGASLACFFAPSIEVLTALRTPSRFRRRRDRRDRDAQSFVIYSPDTMRQLYFRG